MKGPRHNLDRFPHNQSFRQHNTYAQNRHTRQWASNVALAISNNDGMWLSKLFKVQSDDIPPQDIVKAPENVLRAICFSAFSHLEGPKSQVNAFKLLAVEFLLLKKCVTQPNKKWSDVLSQAYKLFGILWDLYIGVSLKSTSWLVPSMATTCNYLNRVAYLADQVDDAVDIMDDVKSGGDAETQNWHTKFVLNSIRSKLGQVRGDEDRHGAYIVLLAQSIKGCMQLGNMQMAAQFLKTIDSQPINSSKVPRGPMVNFRYYLGKLYMQQEAFKKAEFELVWSFSQCPRDKEDIRRNILECLVAIRLRLGILPPASLLEKYSMQHYTDIVSSIKSGEIRKFNYVMETHDRELIKHGTVLCIEQVKFLVYRTLMKRVKRWCTDRGILEKPHIIPISIFTAAFAWQVDELFDDDEMACIIANLINMGYIKGYISWGLMLLVLSKKDPFPNLNP